MESKAKLHAPIVLPLDKQPQAREMWASVQERTIPSSRIYSCVVRWKSNDVSEERVMV
jgi:hypothetical protein